MKKKKYLGYSIYLNFLSLLICILCIVFSIFINKFLVVSVLLTILVIFEMTLNVINYWLYFR